MVRGWAVTRAVQSQATDLNLHAFGTALNDRSFITAQLHALAALPSEAARLRAISSMLYWDVPSVRRSQPYDAS